jgi:hypothetical protein
MKDHQMYICPILNSPSLGPSLLRDLLSPVPKGGLSKEELLCTPVIIVLEMLQN